MNRNRLARTAGIMFIVATVAGVLAVVVLGSIMKGSDFLTKVAAHPNEVTTAAVLEAVMGVACAGIAIALYPVLRERNPGLAIGAVGFRVAEATIFLVAATAMLALVTLSQDTAAAGAVGASASANSSASLLRAVVNQGSVVAVLPFGSGALLYYYAFWQTRILPRWLSGWGLAAMGVMLAVALGSMLARTDFASYSALLMPLALEEMVLAVYLIAKGFRRPVPVETTAAVGFSQGGAEPQRA